MPNQQLVDYIKSQLALSVTKPDLIRAIQAAGWTQADMDVAFASAEGRVPMPPKPPAPAAMPVQPTVSQPASTIAQSSVATPIVKPRPIASSHDPGPGMRLNTVRGPFRSWMLYVVICVIIVVGAVIYLLPILRPLIFGGLFPATTPPAQTITPDQGPPAVGATIDQSSLVSTSTTPTITGTANGFDTLAVLLGTSTATGGEAHVTNGIWSFTVPQRLPPGQYGFAVTAVDSPTGNLGADMAANKVASTTLAQGTLVIEGTTTPAH